MFSITFPKAFWTERAVPVDFNQDKVTTLITEIQKQGTLSFVQHCLRPFTGRPVPDTFLHNLTPLFQGALLHSIEWDMAQELSERAVTYEDCCQLVTPDMTFVVGEKSFPAHRALLCYYSYWANLFQNGMKEAETKQIAIEEDSNDFTRMLEWLYGGVLEWEDVPEAGSNRDRIHEAIIRNLAMLQRMLYLADRYELEALMALCKQRKASLFRLGLKEKPTRGLFLQESLRCDFSAPASPSQFHDVQINGISGNRLVLASRGPFLRRLLESPTVNPPPFFEDWINRHLTKENAMSFIQIAHLDKDEMCKRECCDYWIANGGSLSTLTERDRLLFNALYLQEEQQIELLQSFAIRTLGLLRLRAQPKGLNGWLKEHGRPLRHLEFGSWADDDLVACVAESCPELQSLYICSDVTDSAIEKLARKCQQMRNLILNSYEVTDSSIAKFRELKVLVLRGCSQISSIEKVVKASPNIQILDLSWTKVSDPIQSDCPKLQRLRLEGCRNVTDAAVERVAEHCPKLQKLSLTDCEKITSLEKAEFLQLQTLNLNNCAIRVLEKFAKHCPGLKKLGIQNTMIPYKAIKTKFPNCTISGGIH